jgi:hypothetical protein
MSAVMQPTSSQAFEEMNLIIVRFCNVLVVLELGSYCVIF